MKNIILDNWLSKIIGKQSYCLQLVEKNFKKQNLPKGKMFIWTKIPSGNIKKLVYFQKLGFYVVDSNIQLSLTKKMIEIKNTNVRFAEPGDEKGVRALARVAFKHNRFNSDPQISKKVACKIKEEWAGNYFSGKRGRWMVVVEYKKNIVGFLQLIRKNYKTIVIDLIAVDKRNRGKGLAKTMISYASINCLGSHGAIEVGTQIANTESLALYAKLGFGIISSSYVLHRHQ